MGGSHQYHVTMLISAEQEEAIKLMFREKNWPCQLCVISNEMVWNIVQSGFTDVFILSSDSQGSGEVRPVKEIKSEVANIGGQESLTKEYQASSVKLETPMNFDDEDNLDDDITDENDEFQDNATDTSTNMSTESVTKQRHSKRKKLTSDKHVKVYKNLKRRVKCPLCDTEVASKSILKRHCQRRHPDEWFEFRCADCPSMFKTQCDHVIAVSCNEGKKVFKRFKPTIDCSTAEDPSEDENDTCEASENENDVYKEATSRSTIWAVKILKEEELWKHRDEVKHKKPKNTPKQFEKSNHTPEELREMGHLQCNACGKFFHNDRMLRKHLYYAHRDLMPAPICAVCGTQFQTRQQLWKHKKETNHNDCVSLLKHYQCDSCGKILKGGYYSFLHHQKLACGKEEKELEELKNLPCDICGSTFKTKHQIHCHKKAVHLDAPEVCDVCGNVYKNQLALRAHKKRHDEKNRKYACNDCGRSFFNSSLLKQHIRIHTKEKPFKCPMCIYTSACKENISKHTLSVHKVKAKAIDLRKQKFTDTEVSPMNDVNVKAQAIESETEEYMCHSSNIVKGDEQIPSKVVTVGEPSTSSYVELMNCDVNPQAYMHASVGQVSYQCPWDNPSRR